MNGPPANQVIWVETPSGGTAPDRGSALPGTMKRSCPNLISSLSVQFTFGVLPEPIEARADKALVNR
jgi:hypothetical protein